MFKFNLTLLTIITFSYGITHPPRNTLQWNPNNFGNWRTVKKRNPHKNKIKSKYSLWYKKTNTIIFSRKQYKINDTSSILS